jgi:hypothetical protein
MLAHFHSLSTNDTEQFREFRILASDGNRR